MRRPFQTSLFHSRWIPAKISVPAEQQKLMIVMHGMSDSLESFSAIDLEFNLPWMNYLLLDAPDCFDDGYSWYDLEPRNGPGVRRSRALLKSLLGELALAGWRSKDIFLMGHSQGALMACDCLLTSDVPFAGIVGVSGYLWFFRGWRKQVKLDVVLQTPWLMTYGLRDKVIKPGEIRDDLATLWEAGIPVSARAFNKGHDFDFRSEVPFVRDWLSFVAQVSSRKKPQAQASAAFPVPLRGTPRRTGRRNLPFA